MLDPAPSFDPLPSLDRRGLTTFPFDPSSAVPWTCRCGRFDPWLHAATGMKFPILQPATSANSSQT